MTARSHDGPLLLVLALSACAPVQTAHDPALLIQGVAVVDVLEGRAVPGQDVLILGSRIEAVGPHGSLDTPNDVATFDAEGAYVIPGLWDMHVHFDFWGYDPAVPLLVANGVLGVRDMGGYPDQLGPLRERMQADSLPRLRTVIAGHILDGPTDNWPLRVTIASPEEAPDAIAGQLERGVDFIKVHQQLDRETYLALAAAANSAGIPFAGHVPATMSASEAAEAGQASIEHLTGLPWCEGDDCSAAATVMDVLVEKRVRQVPTLSVYDAMDRALTTGRIPQGLEAYVVDAARDVWAMQDSINAELMPADLSENQRQLMARDGLAGALRLTGALADAGVPLLTGTDMGFPGVMPGFGLHREMALLVEAGLTPLDAVRAATIEPATYLGLEDDLGTVEPGRIADLVLLRSNPLEEVEAVSQIHAVVTHGRLLDRAALDEVLARSRTP